MNALLRGLLDLLYPPRCEVCGRLRREPICASCAAEIALVAAPVCAVCGEGFDPAAAAAPTCEECRRRVRPYSMARSAAYYEGPLVQAIWRFKYHCQMVLAMPLARVMTEALEGEACAGLDITSVDVLCPVPLHPSRLRERGFNQSQLLAEEVGAVLSKPAQLLLSRTRPTPPQVDLPARARSANVRGAFAPAAAEAVTGRRVLLVDDLFTTGATLAECARALRSAGAAEVRVFTLARAIPGWRRPAVDAREAVSAR